MAHVVVLGAGPGPMPSTQEMNAQVRAVDRITGGQSAVTAPGVAKREAK